jgi:hypothetical protein
MNQDLLEKKSLFEKYFRESPAQQLSSFSFVNIFAWQEHFSFEFKVLDDCLCVFAGNDLGAFLYLPPLGRSVSAKTMRACFDVMEKKNSGKGVSRIENVPESLLPFFSEDEFTAYLKSREYCYAKEDVVSFKGHAYKSKRNAYNSFVKEHNFLCLPFSKEMLDECQGLYEEWAKNRRRNCRDEIYRHMLEENHDVHRLLMRFHRELGLLGRVVYIDGKARAYTFGYPLNENVFCVLLEVADLKIKGLSVYIFREFCADPEVEKFSLINAMDDFGMENVGKTKMSFRPALLVPTYTVSRKEKK